MNQNRLKYTFILSDLLTAAIAWATFYYFRKVYVEVVPFEISERFYLGMLFVPLFWISFYFFFGTYNNLKRMYFMKILLYSMRAFLLGTIIIFLFLILDDKIPNPSFYYNLLIALFLIHSLITIIPRLILTNYIVGRIRKKQDGFKTLLIGGSKKAVDIYKEVEELPKGIGSNFIGFINLNGIDNDIANQLPHLGHLNDLESIIDNENIEEVIIALDSSEQERLKNIIARIQGRDIKIKISANMFDLLSGSVKMTNIFGALLIEVNDEIMPYWQFVVKRFMDIIASTIAMLILLPVYIVLSILVKSSSKGPVFFLQERIGKNGVPFKIIKFRTMVVDAEKTGPQLSSTNDSRITKIGKFMRKVRLDEIPQFWNVIKGEMSLVGPRPERQFFIDKIAEREPQFLQLTKVKPGITSWGQVKFGYAENVDEMLQRMKFDLLYLKNMSISLDLKILLYTVVIVFKGSGK
ncbi:sugar transferase [Brumimicrobium aurantiacum]|uniref:Sugar transferase n=1 Tax=Brumimicrobium aurantiacum TaxID=1737063 RepID=A0A3E1EWN8_9FLAO|nr:sugar transferase [Brumimicrobium aurantiacum]RFC53971.1 sugar transferase [Brumimicrobium aurantiacum]